MRIKKTETEQQKKAPDSLVSNENLKARSNDKINKGKIVEESQVSVEKMAAKSFEGWRIKVKNSRCGFIKFIPNFDNFFKEHVNVDIHIPKAHQGRHIGRYALKQAIQNSAYTQFVAHLRKGNLASKKILDAVGFKVITYPDRRQLYMIFRKFVRLP